MGLFDRVERKIESAVNGAFARAFKAEVQPVEIASAMRGAMDDRAAVVAHGRTIVPNAFTIELAPSDYDRLHEYDDVLRTELVASVQEHAESQGYTPGGPLFVEFVDRDDLDTGVFRVLPTAARDPRPSHGRVRPKNELIMPAATAAAQGEVGLAGSAAQAAVAATAGTAAAARAGGFTPGIPRPDTSRPPAPAPSTPAPPAPGHDDAEREAREQRAREQRARDLAAWPDDEHDAPRNYDQSADDPWAGRHARPEPPATAAAPAVTPAPAPDPRPVGRRPWLELGHDSYPLLTAITVIGRDLDAGITLEDSGISRRHCEIRVTPDGPHLLAGLRDLGSTNGTYLNGERLTGTARLADGDRITLGRTSLTVCFGERR